MPKKILTILILLSLSLFSVGSVQADWLDKLKDTAKELTDKAGQAIKEAAPEAPSTSDGEGQVNKPATTAEPTKPVAPETKTVATPTAPATTAPSGSAVTGNNDKTLVMATQKELKRLGYDIGVDGAYGPNTKKAIAAFQSSHSLTADGNVTPDLVSTLKAAPTPMGTATSEKNETAATKAEPATATTTAAAPEKKTPAPKAAEPKAPEPKVEQAAAPQKSLNPGDYDRAYAYEGGAPQLEGKWLLIKDRLPERFYAEIKGEELFAQRDLRSMQAPPDVKIDMRKMVGKDFRKTDSYDPPSVILIRFGGTVITAKNISGGGSANLRFQAKGPEVAALLAHVQAGNDFEFRVDNFEPFLYSEEWTTFSSPPPEIAAAKQAAKDKQAAAQAAYQAEQDKIAAYAETLSPESKIVYEQCEQSNSARTYYSCQCIAQNIGTHVDKTAASQREESEKIFIYHYGEDGKRAVENIDKLNLTAEQK
ncbi:peptidoglycan-binding protein, partial [Sneathiella sp.]|uniref:peptidoglycan-binding domain-containing protein n=1 Tax=Sneathiella sp. TaxID=1964365 RepID=UPI002614D213